MASAQQRRDHIFILSCEGWNCTENALFWDICQNTGEQGEQNIWHHYCAHYIRWTIWSPSELCNITQWDPYPSFNQGVVLIIFMKQTSALPAVVGGMMVSKILFSLMLLIALSTDIIRRAMFSCVCSEICTVKNFMLVFWLGIMVPVIARESHILIALSKVDKFNDVLPLFHSSATGSLGNFSLFSFYSVFVVEMS